jgi:hypothetical protein
MAFAVTETLRKARRSPLLIQEGWRAHQQMDEAGGQEYRNVSSHLTTPATVSLLAVGGHPSCIRRGYAARQFALSNVRI